MKLMSIPGRPICVTEGCTKLVAIRNRALDGTPKYRKKCWKHQTKFDQAIYTARARRYRAKYPDRVNAYARQWYKQNPDKVKLKNRRSNLRQKSGITLERYEELYKIQKGRCAICKEYHLQLVADHSHKTKMIRGLLCPKCNLGLGHFHDDTKLLTKAKRYFTQWSE